MDRYILNVQYWYYSSTVIIGNTLVGKRKRDREEEYSANRECQVVFMTVAGSELINGVVWLLRGMGVVWLLRDTMYCSILQVYLKVSFFPGTLSMMPLL